MPAPGVPQLRVAADLAFSVDLADGSSVAGRLRGSGRRLRLEIDRPEAFAGRADSAALAALADRLASRRLVVDVVRSGEGRDGARGRQDVLLTLGAVLAPWWQRRLTGSRHIRLGGWRGLLAPSRARLRLTARPGGPVLPDQGLLPPPTPHPLAPTFARRMRRRAGTTHDPARGGQPRLVLLARDAYLPGERQPIFWLGAPVTRIGSGPECEIRLRGLRSVHAEIRHDDQDEFVVVSHDPATRVHGAPVTRAVLRTGARLEVGPWTLAFAREEYADHGRPHGGRIGGELGHQRPQPPRAALQGDPRG